MSEWISRLNPFDWVVWLGNWDIKDSWVYRSTDTNIPLPNDLSLHWSRFWEYKVDLWENFHINAWLMGLELKSRKEELFFLLKDKDRNLQNPVKVENIIWRAKIDWYPTIQDFSKDIDILDSQKKSYNVFFFWLRDYSTYLESFWYDIKNELEWFANHMNEFLVNIWVLYHIWQDMFVFVSPKRYGINEIFHYIMRLSEQYKVDWYPVKVVPSIFQRPDNYFNTKEMIEMWIVDVYNSKSKYEWSDEIARFQRKIERAINLDEQRLKKWEFSENGWWIKVVYQPIVDVKWTEFDPQSGLLVREKTVKYEALARMIDPDSWDEIWAFFVNKSKPDQKTRITKIIISKVFNEINSYPQDVSINLWEEDLADKSVIDHIISLKNKYKIDPKKITIELLEWIKATSINKIASNIKKLQNEWFKIWIDDFGTEHANQDLLMALFDNGIYFDILKIDMGLIKTMLTDPKRLVAVTWIIWIVNWFNKIYIKEWKHTISIVAEWVETKECFDYLKQIWVDQIQWFLFGKPWKRRVAEIIELDNRRNPNRILWDDELLVASW